MELKYTATDRKTGAFLTEVATADSIEALISKLNAQGKVLLKIHKMNTKKAAWLDTIRLKNRRVRGKELAIFTRQMAATLKAGLLLTESLETVAEDMENKYFKGIILKIRKDIMSGSSYSLSLSQFPKIFPLSYTSVVRSGEATGKLYKTMESLAKYLEKHELLKEKIKSAMGYPIFIFGFTIFIVALMVLFLIPKFKEIFESAGAELPLVTRIVVGLSDFCIHNILWIILGNVVLIIILIKLSKTPGFKKVFDHYLLKIPIIGKRIIHKALMSNFCRTLGFLLTGGVSMSNSLELTERIMEHETMRGAVKNIRSRVTAGSSLSNAIKQHKIFTGLVIKMTAVGEKTGLISQMLDRTADYYDDEIELTTQNLMTLIEPVLIIVVGAIIAVVIVALYLPIFQISTLVQ